MAKKHRSVIHVEHERDQVIRTVVEPSVDERWFRIFRAIVKTGVWARLTPAAAKSYVVLAEHVNDEERKRSGRLVAWPAITTIAQYCGISRQAVMGALNELEKGKLIERVRGGGRDTTKYEILPIKSAEIATSHPERPSKRGLRHQTSTLDHTRQVRLSGEDKQGSRQGSRTLASTRQAGLPQQRQITESDNSRSARQALIDAGVGDPMLAKLLGANEPEVLLWRAKDFQNRIKGRERKNVGWLVWSIQNHGIAEWHKTTLREMEQEKEQQARHAGRAAKIAEEIEKEKEEADHEKMVNETFEEMDDKEREALREQAKKLFPGLKVIEPLMKAALSSQLRG